VDFITLEYAPMLGIFITAGYPNPEKTVQALKILHESKVDYIELGVPFSDPLADGPVIQRASFEALKQGMNLDKIFDLVKLTREELSISDVESEPYGLNKLIIFSYYNPLYVYGFDKFILKSTELGISGALIPDLPVDAGQEGLADDLVRRFKEAGLSLTLLAALTSSDRSLEKIARLSEPFIYLVSRLGVTGSKSDLKDLGTCDAAQEELFRKISKLKSMSKKNIALGFGIDSPKKVQEVYELGAQMAIVGTKAVRVLEEDLTEDLRDFRNFIEDLSLKAFT
jgi:tryptophan synthase alpha chain